MACIPFAAGVDIQVGTSGLCMERKEAPLHVEKRPTDSPGCIPHAAGSRRRACARGQLGHLSLEGRPRVLA
jgi:hypothetical protein